MRNNTLNKNKQHIKQ